MPYLAQVYPVIFAEKPHGQRKDITKMGYTHYFQFHSPIPEAEFGTFTANARKLIEQAWDVELDWHIDKESLDLNGVGSESHETFVIDRNGNSWGFCKTNYKPYDKVVTAILILARYTYPSMSLSSDGGWDYWQKGAELFESVFHLTPTKETVFGNSEHVYESH